MLPVLMIVLCVVFRIVPHPANFAPVGATAVFAGRTMKPWLAMLFVAVTMFLADVILGWMYDFTPISVVTPFVYGGFFLQSFLGYRFRSKRGGVFAAAGLGSVAFFLLSNLGVWLEGRLYPLTLSGLSACYVAALPFFGGTLVGDLVWSVVLSLLYQTVAKRLEEHPFWVPIPVRDMARI